MNRERLLSADPPSQILAFDGSCLVIESGSFPGHLINGTRLRTSSAIVEGLSVFDPGSQVFLLRFDVSINSYLDATGIWGNPEFVRLALQVNAYSESQEQIDKLKIVGN